MHLRRKRRTSDSDLSHLRLKWLRILFVITYASLAVDALDVLTGPRIPVWYLLPATRADCADNSLLYCPCVSLLCLPVKCNPTRMQFLMFRNRSEMVTQAEVAFRTRNCSGKGSV